MLLSTTSSAILDSMGEYPQWFVAACVTIVAALVIWIVAKLLKWSLYVLMALVVIVGLVVTIGFIFK
jgi:hypothetical protein